MIDVKALRKDFPILTQTINGYPLIYLDNAASTQKPQAVLDAMNYFYTHEYANIHRGVHAFGERATTRYEDARRAVAHFINADADELVFVSNATHGINLIATAWGEQVIGQGDEIIISELEHHSMLVPWQQLALKRNAVLKYLPVTKEGVLDCDRLPQLLSPRTKLLAFSAESNVLGSSTDIARIVKAARSVGARVFIDGAQSVPNQATDVKALDVDFLVFSAHKMLGPTGIGALYIKKELHDRIPPYQYGGGMVYDVDFHEASWRKAPYKFEAGTPPIAQAIGFHAAITYIQSHFSFDELRAHQANLCSALIDQLGSLDRVHILGPVEQLKKEGHLVSFTIDGIHPHDVAAYLGEFGICVRAGHQCAQPLAKKLGIDASIRASFYCYNAVEEVEQLVARIKTLLTIF